MRRQYAQSGMTLVEVLVVMATVVLLAGALLGIGKHVVERGKEDLTDSAINVLVTALEQYYVDLEAFPFVTDTNGDGAYDYTQADLEIALGGSVDTGALLGYRAGSAGLYYYLDQNPNSRKIIDALTESLITTEDDGIHFTLTFTSSGETIDLPWFVDAWGSIIRYEYLPDAAFPVLTSAGPDKLFDTTDDITSK